MANMMNVPEREVIKQIYLFTFSPVFAECKYASHEEVTAKGHHFTVFDIPAEEKEKAFEGLDFFSDRKMDETLIDLHTSRRFLFRDAIVVKDDELIFIASPYYADGGGTIIDFIKDEDAAVEARKVLKK